MRTKLAITAALTVGIMMMGTSSGLALSGISGDGSAGSAQYRSIPPSPSTGTGTNTEDVSDAPPTLGDRASGGEDAGERGDEGDVQATRQVSLASDSADKLPFTGFAAIILLVAGLALVVSGLALRRRTGGHAPSAG